MQVLSERRCFLWWICSSGYGRLKRSSEEKFGQLEQALSHYRVPVEESIVPLFAFALGAYS